MFLARKKINAKSVFSTTVLNMQLKGVCHLHNEDKFMEKKLFDALISSTEDIVAIEN